MKMRTPHTYTIRVWQYGHIAWEFTTGKRKEAAQAWKSWDDLDDYGVELLIDGKRIPSHAVWKSLGIEYSTFWMGRVYTSRNHSE